MTRRGGLHSIRGCARGDIRQETVLVAKESTTSALLRLSAIAGSHREDARGYLSFAMLMRLGRVTPALRGMSTEESPTLMV